MTVDTCGFFVHQASDSCAIVHPRSVGDRTSRSTAGDGLGVGEPTGEPAVALEGGTGILGDAVLGTCR